MFSKKYHINLDRKATNGTFIEPTGDDGGFEYDNVVMYGEEQDVDDL